MGQAGRVGNTMASRPGSSRNASRARPPARRRAVSNDAAQRLAESFETALRLAGGLARLAFLDEPGREAIVFPTRPACPIRGYSGPPLAPQPFSFHHPSVA